MLHWHCHTRVARKPSKRAPGAGLTLVDLKALNLPPLRKSTPNLVHAASGHEVRMVMVAGRVLVWEGMVLGADEEALGAEVVARRVAADPVHAGMSVLDAMQAVCLLCSLRRTGIQVQLLPAFFVGEGAGRAGAGQGGEFLQIQGENMHASIQTDGDQAFPIRREFDRLYAARLLQAKLQVPGTSIPQLYQAIETRHGNSVPLGCETRR